jgi:Peptidase family M28
MRYLIFIAIVCTSAFVNAQDTTANRYANIIDTAGLRHHLYIVAGAGMEGRETTTPGQHKAAAYIEEQFKAMGLLPVWNSGYQQTFPVYQDSLITSALSIDGRALRSDTDFAVSGNSGFNVAFSASEILYVGYGLSDSVRDDYAKVNARGKIVLVTPGAPATLSRGRTVKGLAPPYQVLQAAAQKNGAIALLIVDQNFPRNPLPAKGYMYVTNKRNNPVPNTFFISDSVAGVIMGSDYGVAGKMMKSGVPLPNSYYKTIALNLQKNTEKLESTNVIGMLEGSKKKDESIIVTAHYDHLGKRGDSVIYYGADDDGSGTVSLLEIAQAFTTAAKEGHRPKRNIIFMTVSGEEKGLWGSSFYAEHPAFPLDKTSVDLNIDMVGRVDAERKTPDTLNYIYLIGDDKLSSDMRPISDSINTLHDNITLDHKFNDPADPMRIFYRSDHFNFAKKGVPILFFFSGLHADYHRPTDTPDKINYPLMEKRDRFIFFTAWEMANREEMLKRDIPLP